VNLPFKVCPECGAEHVHTAVICVDCNVALEIAPTEETPEPPPTAAFPPASELTRVAVGSPWEMERLALQLQEANLSSRIDRVDTGPGASRPLPNTAPRGSGARLALYVLPEDAEAARRAIQVLLLQDGPVAAAEAREGAALEACPACGAPIAPTASACSDCGLEFVAVEDACSACGAALPPGATACPSCGAEPTGGAAA
jgi:ribosomal protein L40E